MNPTVAFHLAFILFFPTFCIIAALYCAFPLRPRPRVRWLFDGVAIAVAFACSIGAMAWGFHRAQGVGAPIWQQAASTLSSYAAFLIVLAAAAIFRAAWLRDRSATR